MRGVLTGCAILAALSCGGGATGPSPVTQTETLELRWQSEHFRIFAGATPDAIVRATADRLESEFARILAALELSGVPGVTVRIWQDEATYTAELVRYFGVRYQATGYVTGPAELRLLATPQLGQNAVHEFVHAASLAVNPSLANNPRWLWETVAVYESGERVDPRQLDYLRHGAFPTLQQLNADPNAATQIYQVGFLLGEFVVARWGHAALVSLVRANGDVSGVLGVSVSAFEAAWRAFVETRYLS